MYKKIIFILAISIFAQGQELSLQKGWQLESITQDISNPKSVFSNECISDAYIIKDSKCQKYK